MRIINFLLILTILVISSSSVFAASTDSCFDTDTKLMTHMNGTDGSTAFTDSSNSNHTLSVAGNAQIDTAQSKFGGASALFDGTGDWLTAPDSNDFDLGTGDFTVDFWARFNTLPSSFFYDFISVGCREQGPRIEYQNFSGSTITVYLDNNQYDRSWSPSTGVWYHITVIRTGTTVRIFIDGSQLGADITEAGDLSGGTDGLTIGARSDCSGNRSLPFDGWIEEVRIVKGTAVWTSGFTPPSAEYNQCATRRRLISTVCV